MIIRNGNYTVIKDYHLALHEVRTETPDPTSQFILKWELQTECPLEGFSINLHGDITKIIEREKASNAYTVISKAKYNQEEFLAWGYNQERNGVGLISYNKELAEKYDLMPLSDRYIKEVSLKELDIIWEERTKSEFDLPIPNGIEPKKITWKNPNTSS